MSWFSWFRKKKQPEPVNRLRMYFEYEPGQSIQCKCDWPTGQTEEDNKAIVRDFSRLMYLVGTGKILAAVQQGVVVAGEELQSKLVARSILYAADELLGKSSMSQVGPVVPATQCFRVRRQGGEE
jgi:hypothetical protein